MGSNAKDLGIRFGSFFTQSFPGFPRNIWNNSEGLPGNLKNHRKCHLNKPTDPPIGSGVPAVHFFRLLFFFQKNKCCNFWVVKKYQINPRLETALIEAVGTKTQAPLAGLFLIRMDAKPQLHKHIGGLVQMDFPNKPEFFRFQIFINSRGKNGEPNKKKKTGTQLDIPLISTGFWNQQGYQQAWSEKR